MRHGEELDATRQRAVGHPAEQLTSLAEAVGRPLLVQFLGWGRRWSWRSPLLAQFLGWGRRWSWRSGRCQLRLPDSGGVCEGVQPVEA